MEMKTDEALGPVVLGAAIGGLLGLWLSGALFAIVGAVIGAIAVTGLLRTAR